MPTKTHAIPLRQGRRTRRTPVRTCRGQRLVSPSQDGSSRRVKTEKTASDVRQPPKAAASGTASAAASVEPTFMPVAYTPVADAGRSANSSFTAIGSRAPASPMPTPTGNVSRTTSAASGAPARASPNAPISARQPAIATRVPSHEETGAATGANSPMQSTGIVASSPATA